MLIGYSRTSTADQIAGLEAQQAALGATGCTKVFSEQASSVGQRDQLAAVLDYVRDGDTLVVTRLDRLARSTADLLGIPSGSDVGRFRYTGQAWLAVLGFYYYKARMYSPTLGRFLQTDPIGYADGMNLYAYVGNDPVNWTDPTGLSQWCETVKIGNSGITYSSDGTPQPWVEGKYQHRCGGDVGSPDGKGGGGQGKPQNKNCPAPPTPGAGKSTIDQNIADARLDAKVNALDPFQDPFGAVEYVNNLMQLSLAVTDASRQNYKKNPAFPGSAAYGNFNFGATMQARGFSLKEALRYSNAFQMLTTGRADPAEDVADVTNGYNYAAGGC